MRSKKVLESEGSNYTMLFFFLILSAFLTISLPSFPVSSFEKITHTLARGESYINNLSNPVSWVVQWSYFLGFRIVLIIQTIAAGGLIFILYNLLKKNFKDRELAVNTCFALILCTPWLFFQSQTTPVMLETLLIFIIFYQINESLHDHLPRRLVISLAAVIMLCLESLWYLPLAPILLFFHKKVSFSLSTGTKILNFFPYGYLVLFLGTGGFLLYREPIIAGDLISLVNGSYLTLNHLIFAPFAILVIAVPAFIRKHYLEKVLNKAKKSKKKRSSQKEKEAPLLLKRYLVIALGSVLLFGAYQHNPFLAVFIALLLTAPVIGNVRFPAWSIIVPLLFLPFLIFIFINMERDDTFITAFTILLYLLALLAGFLLIRLVKQETPNQLFLNLSLGIVFLLFIHAFNFSTFYYYRLVSRTKTLLQPASYTLEDHSQEVSSIFTDSNGKLFLFSLPVSRLEHISVNTDLSLIEDEFPGNTLLMLSRQTEIVLPEKDLEREDRRYFTFYRLK